MANIIDSKFRKKKMQYVFQCGLATVAIAALGIVLNGYDSMSLVVIFVWVLALSLVKYLLKPYPRNLLD